MLQVPGGNNLSEGKVFLTFVAPFDPGDRDKHYGVRRHLGDSGSTACILPRHHFDKIVGCQAVQLQRVGPRDPSQLKVGGQLFTVRGVAILNLTIELGWQRVLVRNERLSSWPWAPDLERAVRPVAVPALRHPVPD